MKVINVNQMIADGKMTSFSPLHGLLVKTGIEPGVFVNGLGVQIIYLNASDETSNIVQPIAVERQAANGAKSLAGKEAKPTKSDKQKGTLTSVLMTQNEVEQ